MNKINSLTPAQEKALVAYREKWLKIGRSTEPSNREAAEKAITRMYELIGKSKPRFWWCDGPAVGSMVRAILSDPKNRAKTEILQGSNLENNLESNLWRNLWSDLRSNLESNLWKNLGSNLWGNLESNLENNLGRNLESSLRNNLENNLGSDTIGWYFWGAHEAAWPAHYNFADEVIRPMHSEKDREKLCLWLTLSESTGWWQPFENICFMCERPSVQLVNERGQLHCETGPALVCRDGWEIYSLNGVIVPKSLVLTPAEDLSIDFFTQEKSADVKAEFVRKYGVERMVEMGKVVDTYENYPDQTSYSWWWKSQYQLVNMGFAFDIDYQPYLKMINQTTDIWHMEAVSPACRTLKDAIKERFGGREMKIVAIA